jgi:hypothetical protein
MTIRTTLNLKANGNYEHRHHDDKIYIESQVVLVNEAHLCRLEIKKTSGPRRNE